jgi:hypothetical protein
MSSSLTLTPNSYPLTPSFLTPSSLLSQVCGGDALDLFEAPELELLICGNPVLNFSDLRKGATYEDGYGPSSQAVDDMWKVCIYIFILIYVYII